MVSNLVLLVVVAVIMVVIVAVAMGATYGIKRRGNKRHIVLNTPRPPAPVGSDKRYSIHHRPTTPTPIPPAAAVVATPPMQPPVSLVGSGSSVSPYVATSGGIGAPL
jgi:hypothetical protein